jgi:hypothetical protein
VGCSKERGLTFGTDNILCKWVECEQRTLPDRSPSRRHGTSDGWDAGKERGLTFGTDHILCKWVECEPRKQPDRSPSRRYGTSDGWVASKERGLTFGTDHILYKWVGCRIEKKLACSIRIQSVFLYGNNADHGYEIDLEARTSRD